MNKQIDTALKERPQLEETELKKIGASQVPFASKLSFAPLIEYLNKQSEGNCMSSRFFSRNILEELEKYPSLQEPIEDLSLLEEHRETVDLLFSCILPPLTRKTELAKVSRPMDPKPIYKTPALEELYEKNDVKYILNNSTDIIYCATVIGACSLILNTYYDQDIKVAPPISLRVRNEETGLQRHFKTHLNLDFVKIIKKKELKPLSQQEINEMLSNIYDIDLWLEYIPPENFEFQGLVVGNLIDITEEESLSQLKYSLLQKDALVNEGNIEKLAAYTRNFFGLPDLRLGLTAIDYPPEDAVSHKYKIRFDFLAHRQPNLLAPENKNSLHEKACKYREILLIEDLESVKNKTPIERQLLEEGIRSIIIAPLFNKKEQVIGLLELGSPHPYQLHSFIELKFKEVISLFSLSVERSREEIDNRIEAIIREQFTAVHPSIEWKFIEASYHLLEQQEKNEKQPTTLEPIVFGDVYPLYGQADIVSSSDKRNLAIKNDLVDNLQKAEKVLARVLEELSFPLVDHLLMKVGKCLEELDKEFNSSDETRIVDLLHDEVHPLLENIREKSADLAGPISSYFNHLDPSLQIVYKDRKDYEESVAMINNVIANYLE
ncbi:MAG: hypothetical protein R3350_09060, partial [Saprospiraceae bacterium]|nr:hypothetical protein [Saprospiraceae bacterium]